MQVGTKEFDDIVINFEKQFSHMRLDKETKEWWSRGQVYANGETNNAYCAFRQGYALGRVVYMHEPKEENDE